VVAHLRETRDPLKILAAKLSPEERATIQAEVEALVNAAFQRALDDPYPVL
jgi:TPP-dependent pyruvate/acetoin dehydrogenase alpha subunit